MTEKVARLNVNLQTRNNRKPTRNNRERVRRDYVKVVTEVAENVSRIVAKLIELGYVNMAIAAIIITLVRLVGSDRLIGNAIRRLPYMRPMTSARGPVNYAFKKLFYELQKYLTNVQVPYLDMRERLLATYGPDQVSTFGQTMDIFVVVMVFFYVAYRVGHFSPELMDVVRPALNELKKTFNYEFAMRAVGAVSSIYAQIMQQQQLLDRYPQVVLFQTVAKSVKNFVTNLRKQRTFTEADLNKAFKVHKKLLSSAANRSLPAPANTTRRNALANAPRTQPIVTFPPSPSGFETPPGSPQRIRAVTPQGDAYYLFTRNQWNRLPTSDPGSTSNNSVIKLTWNGQTKFARKSNLNRAPANTTRRNVARTPSPSPSRTQQGRATVQGEGLSPFQVSASGSNGKRYLLTISVWNSLSTNNRSIPTTSNDPVIKLTWKRQTRYAPRSQLFPAPNRRVQ